MGYLLWLLIFVICGNFLAHAKVCLSPLGMGDGSITDDKLSVSSAVSGLASALMGRINSDKGYGAWCPLQDSRWYAKKESGPHYDQYFQILLGKPTRIVAVGTRGRSKNFGYEGVRWFYINYTMMSSGIKWRQYHDWMQPESKLFFGNKDKLNVTKMNYFRPPIIADTFRLLPQIYPVNQVCLRLEIYGCDLHQDLMSYSLNPGDEYAQGITLTDLIFDGIITPTTLYTGLGYLTDGLFANKDILYQKGHGWIGWNVVSTPSPAITFNFYKLRIFNSMTFHCNIRTKSNIKLFESVKVSFSDDGSTFHSFIVHTSKALSSNWTNVNVTVDLCKHSGRVVKIQFKYDGRWILISEVMFNTDPGSGMRLPIPKCKPKTTSVPTTTAQLITNGATTQVNITGFTDPKDDTRTSSLDDAAVAGIVCGVILVLIIIVILLCYYCFCRHRTFQKKPPLYNFIRWELKPYSSSRYGQRVSRLDSSGEEAKNSTLRQEEQNGGVFVDGNAIYASIQNLEEVGKVPEVSVPNKPGKPKNKPPPLPFQKFPPPTTADHYAIPDTPLLLDQPIVDEDGYCSPELKSPLLSPPFSPLPPKPDDHFYTEPGTKTRLPGGYSEPIDAVPTGDGVFRNPVYEDVYAEPYQGVSGTSLYANPATITKVRHETFQEFPREKLFFKEKIGDGQFGEVHLGEAEGLWDFLGDDRNANKRVLIAIKKLKPEVDKNIKEDFFKEVKIMSGIEHENVIRLLGICKDDPMCMIVEYMVNGDLNQFLKEREMAPGNRGDKEKVLTYQALIYMASQVAAGMKYISSLKFVHRDLATRNCLVGHSYTVKIADFGMSRHLYSKHYYRVQGRVILPIRWMAPECILQGKFTTESDIWAFAVTLWEILTLAAEYPYNDLSDEQVIQNVQHMFFRPSCPDIQYLAQPSICPDDVYEMMMSCWKIDHNSRPNFVELHEFMKSRVRLSEMAI